MTDDVRITFTADISDLRRGLAEATSGVADTTAVLKAGADTVTATYASMTRAYAAGAAQRVDLVRNGSDEELAAARAGDRAQTDSALDAVKVKQAQVKEEAQLAQVGHDEERAQLLALEDEREDIERRHLTFLQSTYAANSAAFANAQRQIDELAAQSAVKRQAIESTYLRQVDTDYRRTFEQVGSSVSTQVMQMIRGQESFRQAVGNVLLSIIQSFIQARVRAVADWAAGVLAQTAATTAGETAKTAAVTTGAAARQAAETSATAASATAGVAAMAKSILGSAAETFAGIFGFLSPVMGPAAVGPATAGQATVAAMAAAVPSFAVGAWSLPADMVAQVHAGEMIVPAGPAAMMRAAAGGAAGGRAGGGDLHTHFHVTAMDGRDVRRFFSDNSKHILGAINDGLRSGSHLGLSKLRSPVGV
jgi:hypothetical protein